MTTTNKTTAIVFLLILGVALFFIFSNQYTVSSDRHIYIASKYAKNIYTLEDVEMLLDKWGRPEVIYFQSHKWNGDGTYNEEQTGNFVSLVNEISKGKTKVLTLVRVNTQRTDLNTPTIRENFINQIPELVNIQGYDGAVLFFEPAVTDSNFFNLVNSIKRKLERNVNPKMLGVYAFRLREETGSEWFLTPSYAKELSEIVDFIQIGSYNLNTLMEGRYGFVNSLAYRSFLRDQISLLRDYKIDNAFFAIPYLPETNNHNPLIENLMNVKDILYNQKTYVFYELHLSNNDWAEYREFLEESKDYQKGLSVVEGRLPRKREASDIGIGFSPQTI